ncbi:MAG: FGGY family carbohydrate kinase, partial [Pseudomonadota bacterium]|nr:FGGY family carbohydrate kinase [Pseudomonadota bacterium]
MTDRLYLGIDIGTYESKGVLTDFKGKVHGQAAVKHEMLIPKPGWAEHDAVDVWWGDFIRITKKL